MSSSTKNTVEELGDKSEKKRQPIYILYDEPPVSIINIHEIKELAGDDTCYNMKVAEDKRINK